MKFRPPYSKVGTSLITWKALVDHLKRTAEEKGEFTGDYQHYHQVLEQAFSEMKTLATETSFMKSLSTLLTIKKLLNSFTQQKGQRGCPLVVHKDNNFEIEFAKYYVRFVPDIFSKVEKACQEDKSISFVFKPTVNSLLSQSMITAKANVDKVKSTLPEEKLTTKTHG